MGHTIRPRRRTLSFLALLATFALVAAACGGGGSDSKSDGGGGGGSDDGKPVAGGSVTYGLEGKTTDFCIPSAQLAISGIMVVTAVYDTLTAPTTDPNVYAPYLAKSVEHNADYKTVDDRPAVRHQVPGRHPLNAAAVKQNIDAWRKGTLLQLRVLQHRGHPRRPTT